MKDSAPIRLLVLALAAAALIASAGCEEKKKTVPGAPQASAADEGAAAASPGEIASSARPGAQSSAAHDPGALGSVGSAGSTASAHRDHESLLLELLARADQLTRVASEGDRADRVRFSMCTDERAHGRRLFELLARDAWDYSSLASRSAPAAAGQTLIMRTWIPIEVDAAQVPLDHEGRAPADYLFHDGRWWQSGEPSNTFIMHKMESPDADTDAGWIYGEQSPEGQLRGAGQVESCMSCHVSAANDRLFGLK